VTVRLVALSVESVIEGAAAPLAHSSSTGRRHFT